MPLWVAETCSGHSFVGEFQASVLYPIQQLWLSLFATRHGISLSAAEYLTVLHFALAAAGMFLVLEELRLKVPASLCGAVSFTALGALPARAPAQSPIFFGLALLPWAMWMALRYRNGGKLYWAAGSGAVIGLQILGGHGQPVAHTLLLVAASYCAGMARHLKVDLEWQPFRHVLLGAVVTGITGLVVSGPQLLLSAQYLRDAYRWVGADNPITIGQPVPYDVFAYKAILEPHDFLSVLDPWNVRPDDGNTLYFGTFPLLAVLAMLGVFRKLNVPVLRREGTWLAVMMAFTVLAMLGHHTPLARLLRHTPMLGQVRELGRYAIIAHFVAAVMTGVAVQAWQEAPRWLFLRLRVLLPSILVAVLALIWLWKHESVLSRTAVTHLALSLAVVAIVVGSTRARTWLYPLTFGLLVAHSIDFWTTLEIIPPSRGLTATFDTGTLAPKLRALYSHARVIVDENPNLSANVAAVVGFESKLGYGATLYKPYFDFLNTGWDLDSDVNDLLNVGYVLSNREQPLKVVARDTKLNLILYERSRYYPRVFLASQLGRPGPDLVAEIRLEVLEYTDHVQRFRLRAPSDDLAIASEIAYPGWCAKVNSKSAPISKASINGKPALFRVVHVRGGVNMIEFEYLPFRSMLLGCP